MSLKKLIPKSLKSLGRALLRRASYAIVYHGEPGSRDRFPYASQLSFFQDLRARGYSPGTAIDVGANRGCWSDELFSVFPHVQCVLVEPQEELGVHLQSLCQNRKGWKIAPVGCAGENGIRTFLACEDTVSSSFLKGDESKASGDDVRELHVETLDRIADKYLDGKPANFIKLDAEGLELEILRGSERTIRAADIVMLEVAMFEYNPDQPRFADVVQVMHNLGFAIYDFTMFYRRPHDFALGLMDCVFVSNNSLLRKSHAW
jgi:FkbM family methyltransferase